MKSLYIIRLLYLAVKVNYCLKLKKIILKRFRLPKNIESKIKDKQKLIQLKTFYTKMLLYEFKLTGRDSKFLEDFREVFIYFKLKNIF